MFSKRIVIILLVTAKMFFLSDLLYRMLTYVSYRCELCLCWLSDGQVIWSEHNTGSEKILCFFHFVNLQYGRFS